jgi:hypothetical protein
MEGLKDKYSLHLETEGKEDLQNYLSVVII